MGGAATGKVVAAALFVAIAAHAQSESPRVALNPLYTIRYDHWSETDEKEYGRFIAELGDSGCATVDACLHDARNPFRGTDPPGTVFESDCADLPYVLRFYFA